MYSYMRAKAAQCQPTIFLETSRRAQGGGVDDLMRLVCTEVPVIELSSDEEQVNKVEADTEVDTDEDEVAQVVVVTAPPPAPAPYSHGSALYDYIFGDD